MTTDSEDREFSPGAHQQKLPLTWEGQDRNKAQSTPDPADSTPENAPRPEPREEPREEASAAPILDELPEKQTVLPTSIEIENTETVRVVELSQVQMSLGQTLLEARADCSLTIAQVSLKTKIPKQFIQFIETDLLDHLPPPLYSRSYITQLCREYSIDEGPVLNEYAKATKQTLSDTAIDGVTLTSEKTKSGAKVHYRLNSQSGNEKSLFSLTPTTIIVGGVTLALLLLVLVAIGVQHWHQRQSSQNDVTAETTVPAPAKIRLEEFIIPQQLPMKELPVPEN